MHRFFVPPQSIRESRVLLRGSIVHQIRDVLRMRSGDEIVLLDNSGRAHRTELQMVEQDVVRGRVVDSWQLATEPSAHITLYQGLLKGQKFDWVLQKGTELGITSFVPVIAARCLVGSVDDVSETRVERWQKIITEAAEQSGRAILPSLASPIFFEHACQQVGEGKLSIIPWEEERSRGLREVLQNSPGCHEINLFIGPEGGFTVEEIDTAKSLSLVPVSLGPRILRAETAGIVAASAILFELGDLE
jgi:16S rRNA (uracil1498-N3)-methyltransferase